MARLWNPVLLGFDDEVFGGGIVKQAFGRRQRSKHVSNIRAVGRLPYLAPSGLP